MRRLAFGVIALLALLASGASAGSFRGGTLSWQVHDLAAPRTVAVTVTTFWDEPTSDDTSVDVDFGDGSTSGTLASTVIYTGTTAARGEGYTVRQATTTHTYAADGMYTAAIAGCCRHATENATGSDPYRIEATVALGTGSYGNPAALIVDAEMEAGSGALWGTRWVTATWSGESPVADDVTPQSESGLTPPAGLIDSGGSVSWSLSMEAPGASKTVSIIVTDHGGSTAMLEYIVETVPHEALRSDCDITGGPLGAQPGTTATRSMYLEQPSATATLVTPTNEATLTPTSSPGQPTLSWTPASGPGYQVAFVTVTDPTIHEGFGCGVSLHVPLSGMECEDGFAFCGAYTTCMDTAYGFTCPCDPGYRQSTHVAYTCEAFCGVNPVTCGFSNGFPVGLYCCTDPTAPNGTSCTCPIAPSPQPQPQPPMPSGRGGGCDASTGSPALLVALIIGVVLLQRRRIAID